MITIRAIIGRFELTTLSSGRDIDRLIKLAHQIIAITPGISQVNFLIELESTRFDSDDWTVLKRILGELEFTAAAPPYTEARNFLRSLSLTQLRSVRLITEAFFKISNAGRHASLGLALDSLKVARNDLTDLITDELTPFIDTPPPGVSAVIIVSIKDLRAIRRGERDRLKRAIEDFENQIAGIP